MAALELSRLELPEQIRQFIAERRDSYPTAKAILIPALMECQKYYGQVTPEAARAVAEELSLPFAEVQSVVSFYTMMLRRSTGEYVIGVCGTWNCEHAGADKLIEHFRQKYSVDVGDTTENGLFTLLHVECLCDCHNAPSVQFLKRGAGFTAYWCNNLTIELFDQVLGEIEAGAEDALRERLVRIEEKSNPPDDKRWVWLVTTHNQYPAWLEHRAGENLVHDSYGKLGDLKETNPKLFAEIQAALQG